MNNTRFTCTVYLIPTLQVIDCVVVRKVEWDQIRKVPGILSRQIIVVNWLQLSNR